MSDQPQWLRDFLAADPLVQRMRKAAHHPAVWRDPPVEGRVSPVTVHMECPDCLPVREDSMLLEEVIRAEGVLRCPGCKRDIPILAEDLPNLAALKKAQDSGEFQLFLDCIKKIQDKAMPPIAEVYRQGMPVHKESM